MSNSILVTGGAGFIGSHAVDRFIPHWNKVVVVDNLSATNGSRHNLSHGRLQLVFIEDDIGYMNLTSLMKRYDVEYVFHFAAKPRVKYSVDFPVETNEQNITNTVKVLEAARQAKVKRVIYSASSSAYGNNDTLPTPETCTAETESPYALQKRVGEEYCRMYSKLYGLSTVSLRYFNVFGPRSTVDSAYSAVIPIFIEQILNGGPITIHGDGNQTRDFTHVSNVAGANFSAAISHHNLMGEVFNVGCGESYSVKEVALRLMDILDKRVSVTHESTRPGDVPATQADITKIKKMLDYRPDYMFESGLEDTVKWYLKYLEKK